MAYGLATDLLTKKYEHNITLPPDRAGAVVRGSIGENRIQVILSVRRNGKPKKAQSIVREARIEAAKIKREKILEAKSVIIATIQRMAAEQTVEHCSLVVKIESDAIKGEIIGKEGRNIRALEAATGVDIIVDDTPETVLLSSFELIKREIARLALQQLIQDSRVHPAHIEEVVARPRSI